MNGHSSNSDALVLTEESRLLPPQEHNAPAAAENAESKKQWYGDAQEAGRLSMDEDDDSDDSGNDANKTTSTTNASVWDMYMTTLHQRPVLVKSLTAFFILAIADACGQCIEHIIMTSSSSSSEPFDLGRMMRFGVLGLLGTPFVHYYYQWLDQTLPPTSNPWTKTTFVKLIIDQGIQAPLVTLMIFVFVGVLEGKNIQELQTQLQQDYLSTLIANWKLFIPAQIINLAFCPPPLRVLFLNVVFFFWSIILSVILHGNS